MLKNVKLQTLWIHLFLFNLFCLIMLKQNTTLILLNVFIIDLDSLKETICIPKPECPCVDENGREIFQGQTVTIDCQEW